ncbi:MAG: MBL fold metallo-hydrolase [Candidatus Paceibacterota bacterium]|jgi:glyoxylase-like metal-dependent hydrolase (beta-lactamase superfamily II)
MEIKKITVGELQTNCYLFISDGESAVIDPGGEAPEILAWLKKAGAKPKYIINTHYHFDHTLANQAVKKDTGAFILIHEAEKDFIDFKADRFLKEGEEIKIGGEVLKIIHTPGHTPGSICLLGNGFLFSGDTLFDGGYGRTDLPGGSDNDMALSLEKLDDVIEPKTKVYPGHGPEFIKLGE